MDTTSRAKMLAAAIGTLVAMSATQLAQAAEAAQQLERCYGVNKAGKNDCATGAHTCMTLSKIDRDDKSWVNVPKGTCDKLAGGSLTPK
jgi:uncharacterized membrane protein